MDGTEFSNKIATYKTDKKLIEFLDKLNPSTPQNYAELHGCTVDGRKTYSVIGVRIYDYSKGTGNKTVKVNVNITPEDVMWIYAALNRGDRFFDLEQTKIFGSPDQNGYSSMTKIHIVRAETDKNGQQRKFQWCVLAENGKGIPCKTKVGGTYCKSGSYQATSNAYININDYDFFKIISRCARYIQQFENAYCPAIIRQGKAAYQDMLLTMQME